VGGRSRSRRPGLVLGAVLLAVAVTSPAAQAAAPRLVVRDAHGAVLAHIELPRDATFALRYRNSVYGSIAEERFALDGAAAFTLVELAAVELAVLEEYYSLRGPARAGGGLGWVGEPDQRVVLHELRIAATDLGRRTLIATGLPPLELWQLVDDTSPTVVLEVERGR
jgi:hypothetical protein